MVTKYAYKYAQAVNVSHVMIFFKTVFEMLSIAVVKNGISNTKFSASSDEMKGSDSSSK